jgi:hypothetical protein
MAQPEDELSNTTFDIYLYLVKIGAPTGPRDLMRAMDISSPGVVHRHLQKLADLDWVEKDAYGRYTIKKKIGFRGYIWVGKRLIPLSTLFAITFMALAVIWICVFALHLGLGSPIDQSYSILTVVTVIAAVLFVIEAFRPRKRVPKKPTS